MLMITGNYERNWKWLLALGVLFVILSFICLNKVISVTLVSIIIVGICFLIAGMAQLIDVFYCKNWDAALWHAVCAFLYAIIGGLIVFAPFPASSIITIFIALSFIFLGFSRLIMAVVLKPNTKGWFFLLINSLAAIVLGGFILAYLPASSLVVIGLLISIELMISGWVYIFLAFNMRQNQK